MASSKLQFTVKIGGLRHDGGQGPWQVPSYSSLSRLVDFAMMEDRVRGKFQATVHCKDWWTLLQFAGRIGGLCSDGGQVLWQIPRYS